MLEHGPRMESYQTSECLEENSEKIRQESCDEFLQNMELILECFSALPRCGTQE